MKTLKTMLNLDEIGLLPTATPSDIDTRKSVDPFIHDESLPDSTINPLPVFVSPMTSVIDKDNLWMFEVSRFIPILPRKISFTERLQIAESHWVAFSLQEFIQIYDKGLARNKEHLYILVDIANGHIKKLYDYAKKMKEDYPHVTLMIGNIAHPEMYKYCCMAHVDYVRIGIGGGSVCSTSVQCGVHASLVWMIEEINRIKKTTPFEFETKLIADGGINTLDRAIKCLALGYDYVMIGKLFAMSEAACGEVRTHIKTYGGEDIYIAGDIKTITGDVKERVLERKYYGMASEQGQIDISGGANKNPEGVETWVKVEYKIGELRAKFEAALRSTMSYVNAHDLQELHETEYLPMSEKEFKSYYK